MRGWQKPKQSERSRLLTLAKFDITHKRNTEAARKIQKCTVFALNDIGFFYKKYLTFPHPKIRKLHRRVSQKNVLLRLMAEYFLTIFKKKS